VGAIGTARGCAIASLIVVLLRDWRLDGRDRTDVSTRIVKMVKVPVGLALGRIMVLTSEMAVASELLAVPKRDIL